MSGAPGWTSAGKADAERRRRTSIARGKTNRPTKKPTKRKRPINYQKVAKKLAECVAFALKFAKHLSKGSGVTFSIKRNPKTGAKTLVPGKRWEDDFMDALDAYGYVIDREAYFKSAMGKRRSVS